MPDRFPPISTAAPHAAPSGKFELAAASAIRTAPTVTSLAAAPAPMKIAAAAKTPPADTRAAPPQPEALGGVIGRKPAKEIGEHTEEERQSREQTQLRSFHAAHVLEVRGKPSDVEIKSVGLREVHDAKANHVALAKHSHKVAHTPRMMAVENTTGLDPTAFGRSDTRVFRRIISKPAIPRNYPGKSDKSEDDKHGAPVHDCQHPGDEQRSNSTGEMGAHKKMP